MAEKRMLRRTRIILSALGIAFAAGFIYAFGQMEEILNPNNLLALFALAAGFTACSVILIGTFFELSKQDGTIKFTRYNLFSRILGGWQLSLCSAFWFFVVVLWLSMALIALLTNLSVMLYGVVQENWQDALVKSLALIGGTYLVVKSVAGLIWLSARFKPVRILLGVATVIGWFRFMAYCYVIMPIKNIMKTQEIGLKEAFPIYGKHAAIVVLAIAVIIAIIAVAVKYIPRLKNTFLGKWLDWVLSNSCPGFAIEESALPPEKPVACKACGQLLPAKSAE